MGSSSPVTLLSFPLTPVGSGIGYFCPREGHALSACVFLSPGRLGGSETDQMLGHYGLRSDSGATCMDSTWEIVTCVDFLSPFPSQPSQTLPFHKRPGDVLRLRTSGRE